MTVSSYLISENKVDLESFQNYYAGLEVLRKLESDNVQTAPNPLTNLNWNVDELVSYIEGDEQKRRHREEKDPHEKTKPSHGKKEFSPEHHDSKEKIPPYCISNMTMHRLTTNPESSDIVVGEITPDMEKDFTVVERRKHRRSYRKDDENDEVEDQKVEDSIVANGSTELASVDSESKEIVPDSAYEVAEIVDGQQISPQAIFSDSKLDIVLEIPQKTPVASEIPKAIENSSESVNIPNVDDSFSYLISENKVDLESFQNYNAGLEVLRKLESDNIQTAPNPLTNLNWNVDELVSYIEGDEQKKRHREEKDHHEKTKPSHGKKEFSQEHHDSKEKIPPYCISNMTMHRLTTNPDSSDDVVSEITPDMEKDFTVVERRKHRRSYRKDDENDEVEDQKVEEKIVANCSAVLASVDMESKEIVPSSENEVTEIVDDQKLSTQATFSESKLDIVKKIPQKSSVSTEIPTGVENSSEPINIPKLYDSSSYLISENKVDLESFQNYYAGLEVLRKLESDSVQTAPNPLTNLNWNVDELVSYIEGDEQKRRHREEKDHHEKTKPSHGKKEFSPEHHNSTDKIPPYCISNMTMHRLTTNPESSDIVVGEITPDMEKDFTIVERRKHRHSYRRDEESEEEHNQKVEETTVTNSENPNVSVINITPEIEKNSAVFERRHLSSNREIDECKNIEDQLVEETVSIWATESTSIKSGHIFSGSTIEDNLSAVDSSSLTTVLTQEKFVSEFSPPSTDHVVLKLTRLSPSKFIPDNEEIPIPFSSDSLGIDRVVEQIIKINSNRFDLDGSADLSASFTNKSDPEASDSSKLAQKSNEHIFEAGHQMLNPALGQPRSVMIASLHGDTSSRNVASQETCSFSEESLLHSSVKQESEAVSIESCSEMLASEEISDAPGKTISESYASVDIKNVQISDAFSCCEASHSFEATAHFAQDSELNDLISSSVNSGLPDNQLQGSNESEVGVHSPSVETLKQELVSELDEIGAREQMDICENRLEDELKFMVLENSNKELHIDSLVVDALQASVEQSTSLGYESLTDLQPSVKQPESLDSESDNIRKPGIQQESLGYESYIDQLSSIVQSESLVYESVTDQQQLCLRQPETLCSESVNDRQPVMEQSESSGSNKDRQQSSEKQNKTISSNDELCVSFDQQTKISIVKVTKVVASESRIELQEKQIITDATNESTVADESKQDVQVISLHEKQHSTKALKNTENIENPEENQEFAESVDDSLFVQAANLSLGEMKDLNKLESEIEQLITEVTTKETHFSTETKDKSELHLKSSVTGEEVVDRK